LAFLVNTKISIIFNPIFSLLQTEQEITGDVLLELDINLLKSEIGIMAFGKRMRIANAIADLRRPPSIEYSDHQLSPMQLHHSNSLTQSQFQSQMHPHSRTQSQSQSHHSFPGTTPAGTVGHVHSHSMQSSIGNPGVGAGQYQLSQVQDSPVSMRATAPVVIGNGAVVGIAAGMSAAAGVGLGIALSPTGAPSVDVSSFSECMGL
jgi:hypothetical protein